MRRISKNIQITIKEAFGNGSYADEQDSPVVDFFCGLIGGGTGFFNFPSWLLVYFGWLSAMATLLLRAKRTLAERHIDDLSEVLEELLAVPELRCFPSDEM